MDVGPAGARRRKPPVTRVRARGWAQRAAGLLRIDTAGGHPLAVMVLMDSIGTGLFLASGIVIFTRMVGLTGPQVGIGFAIAGCVSLATVLVFGGVVDRYGAR